MQDDLAAALEQRLADARADSAGAADLVIVSNDGAGARALVGNANSPVRWFVMGIPDR